MAALEGSWVQGDPLTGMSPCWDEFAMLDQNRRINRVWRGYGHPHSPDLGLQDLDPESLVVWRRRRISKVRSWDGDRFILVEAVCAWPAHSTG